MSTERFWWAVHNLIAHPLMEILFWVGQTELGDRIHNSTARRAVQAKNNSEL